MSQIDTENDKKSNIFPIFKEINADETFKRKQSRIDIERRKIRKIPDFQFLFDDCQNIDRHRGLEC